MNEKDFGSYECKASNRVGTEVGRVELTGEVFLHYICSYNIQLG